MSVLDRAALEASPLADLHAIASELSIDGYRRLRRAELIEAILGSQDGEASPAEAAPPDPGADTADPDVRSADPEAQSAASEAPAEAVGSPARRRRNRRGGRGRGAREEPSERDSPAQDGEAPQTPEESGAGEAEEDIVEGVVELLPNGSAFLRVAPPEPSDEDVYISAAQVTRCELISGDRVGGPRRLPRRSERFASLIRIETINGQPAEELSRGLRFDDLPAVFPDQRLRLGSEDPTVKAIEWLTPFGRGSRVTIVGPARAGKTEALRRLAGVLREQDDLELLVALAGVRPEELGAWSELGPVAASSTLAASADLQSQAVERVVDQARRVAARGGDVVLVIDTLDGLNPVAARRALAAARNIDGGGSLTVIATASQPLGGETTVIALDLALASTGRFPAVDLVRSGTLRPALLVGDAGAEAIARARAEALEDLQVRAP